MTKSGNWFIDQLNVYQAANSDPESIKKNFIVRKKEFQVIIDSLSVKEENDPFQHELILGNRGSGKSTLLKRIEIEVLEDENLSKKYIPVNLAEEQAGIYRLFDLWEQVLRELKAQFEQGEQLREYSEFGSDNEYARYLYSQIHRLCASHCKKIVLLLDNIDRVVENFTDDGHLLRETLINYSDVQIIGASTRMNEHFWRYDMPFYEFFRVHRLKSLSSEAVKDLLLHWSESLDIPKLKTFIEQNPGKLENIRILTDGLPRTLQFFIQMVLQKPDLEGYDYLKKIMDNVSPLFQERMNSLTPPLRKTVFEMAFIWEACSTKQLAQKVKMESKLVSANLRSLVQKGIVEKIKTGTKNHLYRLSEHFFNLWIIVTQGNPGQKRRARWLSLFLESFYTPDDLKQMAKIHLGQLKEHKIPFKNALILTKALSQSKYLSTSARDELLEQTEKYQVKEFAEDFVYLPKKYKDLEQEIYDDIDNKNYEAAKYKAERIENEGDGRKFFLMGSIYLLEERFNQAKKYFLKAIEKGLDEALSRLAVLYEAQEDYGLAEEYYLKAIDKGDKVALFSLATLYYNQNKNKEKVLELLQKCDASLNLIIAEIWNGTFKDLKMRVIAAFKEADFDDLNDFITDMLIHQQRNLMYKLFTHEQIGEILQEKYAPLYYVTLLLSNKGDKNLKLKIPPELQSTLDKILETIREKEIFYGYKKA